MTPQKPPPRLVFEALHRKYRSDVGRWARKAGVPAQDTEDLTQNVFLALDRALQEGRFAATYPRLWLAFVTARMARDHLKSAPVRQARLAAGEAPVPTMTSPLRADQTALEHEACERTNALLETLPQELRSVLEKVAFEEMTLSEVAEELGINPNTVASRLRLARKAIAAALARRRARERGAFLVPFGLCARPVLDVFAAMCRRAATWIAGVRAALAHALLATKAGWIGIGVGAAAIIGIGAGMALPVHASDPAPEAAPKIAVAIPAVSAEPAPTNEPSAATSSTEPPAAPRTKGATRTASDDPERRSLESIEALLHTDPAAALAAVDRHKQRFPEEKLAAARLGVEVHANQELRRRQAHPGAVAP